MRFGVFLPSGQWPGQSHGEVLGRTVAAAQAAEAAGFDDVWLAEHHFMSYGLCPSAVTLAGFVLGATSRIEVGTAVSVLSNQHPVALAEQASLLSLVSGGRFRLGVGRGGPWQDLEVFGTGLSRFEAGFGESLDLLLTWLRSPRVGWSGDWFRFREVPVVPRPSSPLPVVVACTSEATERLAAERGLPMLLGMHIGDEEKAAAITRYQAIRPESGGLDAQPLLDSQANPAVRPETAAFDAQAERAKTLSARGVGDRPVPQESGVGHIATGIAFVGDRRADAIARVCGELPRWLGPGLDGYVRADGRPHPRRDPYAYARELCDLHAVGTPEDCVAALIATAERTGIRHIILLPDCTGLPEETLENIGRLGAEVIPKVRAAFTS